MQARVPPELPILPAGSDLLRLPDVVREDVPIDGHIPAHKIGTMSAPRIDEPEEAVTAERWQLDDIDVVVVGPSLERTANEVPMGIEVDPAADARRLLAVLV